MSVTALATDYDGTLARNQGVAPEVLDALERFREAGMRLVLVTGRELPELRTVCPRLDLFDRVVAENGGLLYRPGDGTESVLANPPPSAFIEALGKAGASRVSVGRVVVATWRPHDETARSLIEAMGLPLRVILNKRAVMILPDGVDKASGLDAALAELGIPAGRVAGIGDAENDLAFLRRCGLSAAVANALPVVKQGVDFVTSAENGAGVMEWLDRLGGR